MISLLVVNFRSAQWTAEAVRTARAATTEPLQVVIVDNSCDPDEAARLRSHADVLVIAPTNSGYAGGVNLGRRACTGNVIVVSNPDVEFAPDSIDQLVASLQQDVAVAGPALFWDAAQQWKLPPGDLSTGRERIDAILASRSREWFAHWSRRRLQKRVAFWTLREPTNVRMLSGAVLALRASDFDRIGGFDERFPLYFEETDFLRRIAEAHRRIVYVPAARCRHLFNQSAGQVADEAAARYARSEMRYLEKWNGPWAAGMLKRLERPLPAVPERALPASFETGAYVDEASPLASFATAAGRFSDGSNPLTLPSDVFATLQGTPFYLRRVHRETGEVLAAVKLSS
jgi:N-acetylglucosaminyl-diphospho-decaprenol L-rhamnosyltransferase